jgi:hypothetical protein
MSTFFSTVPFFAAVELARDRAAPRSASSFSKFYISAVFIHLIFLLNSIPAKFAECNLFRRLEPK